MLKKKKCDVTLSVTSRVDSAPSFHRPRRLAPLRRRATPNTISKHKKRRRINSSTLNLGTPPPPPCTQVDRGNVRAGQKKGPKEDEVFEQKVEPTKLVPKCGRRARAESVRTVGVKITCCALGGITRNRKKSAVALFSR